MSATTVCVTGGSGFLGSYVVKLLLEKGYRVNTTVRDVNDAKKVAHLLALPGAAERLELFQADLLEEGSYDKAIEGCAGVFHTASPFFLANQTHESLVVPALQGTRNVLDTCARHPSVRRVIVTSSTASVYVHLGTKPADQIFTEADWSNVEGMEARGMWYCVSKTLAERAALDYPKEHSVAFEVVTMCPTMIFGPMLQPVLNESSQVVYNLLTGVTKEVPNNARAVVDVRDVAAAHIAGFEVAAASGRYILVAETTDDFEIRDAIVKAAPSALNVPTTAPPAVRAARTAVDMAKATKELGISFRPLDEMVQSTCDSLQQHGFVRF
ncbi:hypothetical protein SPRG_00081 [Saprolegnia parasitica CBS 223.65]|uniref:3-beta hydroxysteroid dehydrogenase/isomerase domain-containing protein n=1 Tax=Saprolegnia parasitica (strain CBS 223.65) TaxID=695850 RepID=A0A067D9D8_SAPPC|nr:hypothetical protein SPRG_00081 [Saprolegnia parasitica CBS 223.65]KDO35236.1 hypothetical protein SPRG_00081 [Saprolegnia parasitica CBS 223.65]|eukprot:XP_012193587.1 hypothetical protein SPRG_00081 [Saprolegnia parasitica CBS 223.65]